MRSLSFTVACPFGGGGGGAKGFQDAMQALRDVSGSFTLLGGYDFDPYACEVFRYLTGVEEAHLDATTATPEDMRRLFGSDAPDVVFQSPPCKGSSKLLSSAKAATEKYVAMNDLAYRGTALLLQAWPDRPPPFLLYENVPNITTRAKRMLKDLRALLRANGYVLHDGYHEAREMGDLAQRRKRWFMVARHVAQIPAFLYKPPRKKGKVCGDVLGTLPLPNDPAGGPMHQLGDTSMLNLLRLWAIPAGGDWRDLLPQDGTPRRARFRRHHLEKWAEPSITIGGPGSNGPCAVQDPRVDLARANGGFTSTDHVLTWDGPSRTITSANRPGNGAPSVADPRGVELAPEGGTWFNGAAGVAGWDEPTRTVIAGRYNGATNVADPRPAALNLLGGAAPDAEALRRWEQHGVKPEGQTAWFNGKYGVTGWGEPTRTVIGGEANGVSAVADPRAGDRARRFKGSLGVLSADEPAGTITSEAQPSTGRFSIAAPVPLVPQAGNADMHWGKYVVVGWDGSAQTVTGASRVGSGAQAVQDPRVALGRAGGNWHEGSGPGRWGVLSQLDPSGAVTGNARVNTGPYSYAAEPPRPVDLLPTEKCYDAGYGVLSPEQPARTIVATAAVGCGAYAIATAAPPVDLHLGCAPRAGAYGVATFEREAATVIAHARVDNSAVAVADPRRAPPPYVVLSFDETQRIVNGEVPVPFAVVDPAHPHEPLAIVDDLKRPPFRWVETKGPRGKTLRKRETVALVLISADWTWHRPLTTLELAVLQGLPWMHGGGPLTFGKGTTAQREVIGNMVPPPVARAMAEQMLLSLIAAKSGSFFLGSSDTPVWVRQLAREGVHVARGRGIIDFGGGLVLNDGAIARRPVRRKARPAMRSRSRPVHHEARVQ